MQVHFTRTAWLAGLGLVLLGGGAMVALDGRGGRDGIPRDRMAALEPGVDRLGQDYASFEAGSPQVCSDACLSDARCRAFSFDESGRRCWLKADIPEKVASNGFVSGVKVIR